MSDIRSWRAMVLFLFLSSQFHTGLASVVPVLEDKLPPEYFLVLPSNSQTNSNKPTTLSRQKQAPLQEYSSNVTDDGDIKTVLADSLPVLEVTPEEFGLKRRKRLDFSTFFHLFNSIQLRRVCN